MKKNKNPVYPSKKSINLCIKEESPFALKKLLPLLLVLIVLAALFGKFVVADRYDAMYAAQSRVAQLEQQKDSLTVYIAGYDELLEEYNRYSTRWMTDDENLSIKRTEMLDLIEEEFIPHCDVLNVSAAGNVLSVQLGGISLDDTSVFVQALYERDDVDNVAVFNASAEDGEGSARVQMVITMVHPDEGGNG